MSRTEVKKTAETLPLIEDGEIVTIVNIDVRKKQTKPPSLYTEGTLLDDMRAAAKFVENDPELKKVLRDASGLGTAATRDSIIEGLKHDKYIDKKGNNLIATDKGTSFILWLESHAPELVDVAMTARWEAELGVVAQQGGGAKFESKVEDFVKKLVATLKDAKPLQLKAASTLSTSKENSSMSDSQPTRTSGPTEKQLDYAKNIAKKLGIKLTEDVQTDFEACKAFIDANKDAASKPSEKQINFARSIAERKGLELPPEVLAQAKEISKWIDANM